MAHLSSFTSNGELKMGSPTNSSKPGHSNMTNNATDSRPALPSGLASSEDEKTEPKPTVKIMRAMLLPTTRQMRKPCQVSLSSLSSLTDVWQGTPPRTHCKTTT